MFTQPQPNLLTFHYNSILAVFPTLLDQAGPCSVSATLVLGFITFTLPSLFLSECVNCCSH